MEYKITKKWVKVPSEEPNHSYIDEHSSLNPNVVRLGPIPDVLIDEVLHELKESHVQALNNTIQNTLGEGKWKLGGIE